MATLLARRYAEPVVVFGADGVPSQIVWRGRPYLVTEVLARWVRTTAWWTGPAVASAISGVAGEPTGGIDEGEREFYRVAVVPEHRRSAAMVVDLCFTVSTGRWSLTGTAD